MYLPYVFKERKCITFNKTNYFLIRNLLFEIIHLVFFLFCTWNKNVQYEVSFEIEFISKKNHINYICLAVVKRIVI